MNNWKWPFHLFSNYFNSLPDFSKDKATVTKYLINSPIMEYIKNRVGDKQLLRYHNSYMSDEQFNDWWMLCHGAKTDAQINEYYTKYPIK